jgi:DNA-binding NtrC family response regulator
MQMLPSMLVVEDDSFMRKLIVTVATELGYPCFGAGTAEEGWELYERHEPRVAILDWGLPGADGLSLCRRIKDSSTGARCIVVMLTGRKGREGFSDVLAAGGDDYLIKPCDPENLRLRLTIAWTRARNVAAGYEAELAARKAHEALARSHADLLSILDQIDVGTAIVDGDGRVVFLSRSIRALLGDQDWLGKPVVEAFPVVQTGGVDISTLLAQPSAGRRRVPIRMRVTSGLKYVIEVDVRVDPRDETRRILYFYDVTPVHTFREQVASSADSRQMVGNSLAMQRLRKEIAHVAPYDLTVLIEGETGSGKELVARAIHAANPRRSGPFVAINCGGLTESLLGSQLFGHRRGAFTGAVDDHAGLFEAAHGGTLFLDEIGDIPLSVQTSLLRVLQEREVTRLGETRPRKVDVRLICATHRDLSRTVDEGQMRADFLYRIREGRIRVPALRDRIEDIPLLCSEFLAHARSKFDKPVEAISAEAMEALMNYAWPGNVRELASAVAHGFVHASRSTIDLHNLPPEVVREEVVPNTSTYPPDRKKSASTVEVETASADESKRILEALRMTGNSRTEAAKLLGISRATLYRKLEKLGVSNTVPDLPSRRTSLRHGLVS